MRVLPSLGEPDLYYLLLTRKERQELRKALKGTRGIALELRRLLK